MSVSPPCFFIVNTCMGEFTKCQLRSHGQKFLPMGVKAGRSFVRQVLPSHWR